MRSFALLMGSFLLFGFAAQTSVPAPLASNYDKLAAAKSLTVAYNWRVLGEAPGEYKLSLSKPNLFRLIHPDGFVLSDGKTLFTFSKGENSYTETPLTEQALADFGKRPELFAWAAFFAKNPSADLLTAKAGAKRTIQGKEVTSVDLTLKGGESSTVFVDTKLGIARGYSFKTGDKEFLAMATAIETGAEPMPEAEFAFVAPEGAKKAEAAKPMASYVQVQQIMKDSCMPCHSAQTQRASVNLSSYEGVVAAVTPGQGAASRLVRSLRASGRDRMPKNKPPLPEHQIKLIEQWIDSGAKRE